MKKKYIFYFPVHKTHQLFRFKRRFWNKVAFAGHGTSTDNRKTFYYPRNKVSFQTADFRSPQYWFPSVCFRQTWTYISNDNLPINWLSSDSVLQPNSVFSWFWLMSSPFDSNYQWILVEWSLYFPKSPKKPLSRERAQEVKNFSPEVRWGTKIRYEHEQWYL